jgi:hypothetical protein
MEPEVLLPPSQEPATGPCPELDESRPPHPTCFPKIHCSIVHTSTPKSSEWSLPFTFYDQNFVCISHLTRACYMLHLILDLITLMILSEGYKL